MNKKIFLIFIASLFACNLKANVTATNKTFFMPRPPGRELYSDYCGWYKTRRHADNTENDRAGFSFQVTGFYRNSRQHQRQGGYFGAGNKSILNFGSGAKHAGTGGDRSKIDIPVEDMIHRAFEYRKYFDDGLANQTWPPPAFLLANHAHAEDVLVYDQNQPGGVPGGLPARVGVALTGAANANQYHIEFQKLADNAAAKGQAAAFAVGQYTEGVADFKRLNSGQLPSGKIDLEPETSAYGARFGFYANLPKFGFFRINIPVLRVSNRLNLKADPEDSDFIKFLKGEFSTNFDPNNNGTSTKTLADTLLLTTGVLNNQPQNYTLYRPDNGHERKDAQKPLLYNKIKGLKKSDETGKSTDKINSDFGLGDIDIAIGRRIADADSYDCSLYLNFTIPTSKKPTGEFLFEPLRGNGRHFEFSAGLEGTMDIWKSEGWTLEAFYNVNFGYIFTAEEKRTLDAWMDNKVRLPWQRYFLTGEVGKKGALTPLANLTTLDVNVRPGFKSEGFFGLAIQMDQLCFDFGYALWTREAEKVRFKGEFKDNKIMFVDPFDYRTYENVDNTHKFSPHQFASFNNTTVDAVELDTSSASTPAQLTQTFWGALTYLFCPVSKRCPMAGTFGMAYEFGQDSASLVNWSVWGKLSFAF